MENSQQKSQPRAEFLTTRWSLVRSAAGADSDARQSLEELCSAYWYPLYAFVRRRGHQSIEAEDLTQGFFTLLLSGAGISIADPERGRFRSFLLAALNHYMVNDWEAQRAQKRGGDVRHLSFDWQAADQRYEREPSTDLSPEKLYERSWALSVLDRAMGRLAQSFSDRGRGKLFEALKPRLTPYAGEDSLTELAQQLDMTEGSLRVALHRFRGDFRAALRTEVGDTLDNEAEVEEELQGLFEALA